MRRRSRTTPGSTPAKTPAGTLILFTFIKSVAAEADVGGPASLRALKRAIAAEVRRRGGDAVVGFRWRSA
jgi:hypothetical protein